MLIASLRKEFYPAVTSWIFFEYPRWRMTIACLCPFSSFNISETKHFIKDLTTDIIVTSEVLIDNLKLKYIAISLWTTSVGKLIKNKHLLYENILFSIFLNICTFHVHLSRVVKGGSNPSSQLYLRQNPNSQPIFFSNPTSKIWNPILTYLIKRTYQSALKALILLIC